MGSDDEEFTILMAQVQEFKKSNKKSDEKEFDKWLKKQSDNNLRLNSMTASSIYDSWSMLTESEKYLCYLYPVAAISVKSSKEEAWNETERRFAGNGNGDKSDAFRHAYWNVLMTNRIGVDLAERFATAHEDRPENPILHKTMDLTNNNVGRMVALENPDLTYRELSDKVRFDKRLVYVDSTQTKLILVNP